MSQKLKDTQEPTLDTRINEALANTDSSGKLKFNEDIDPLFKRAVVNERKARDNQASFTKSRQEIAELKAKSDLLEKTVVSNSAQLSPQQAEELENIKYTNPDEWFQKKQQYEYEASQSYLGGLDEQINEASKKAISDLTAVERSEKLATFTQATGVVLTDDILKNDIPPRLASKINDMPFEDYLRDIAEYLSKGKVVKPTDSGLDATNISKMAGGDLDNSKKSSSYQII